MCSLFGVKTMLVLANGRVNGRGGYAKRDGEKN